MSYAIMGFGLGTDLVVTRAGEAAARAEVQKIVAANEAKQAKYAKAMADYNQAVAARAKVQKLIDADQAMYKNATLRAAADASAIQQSNQSAQMAYERAHTDWQTKNNAYQGVMATRAAMVAGQAAANAAVINVAGAPAGYPGCLTKAEKDAYAKSCASQKQRAGQVRGLGLADPVECYWQNLPLCQTLPAIPPSPGAEPTKPKAHALPKAPPPPATRKLPAVPLKPTPPVLETPPNVIVKDGPAPDQGPRSLAVAGLLALVIVGGGAAYYFTRPKKKAAA